MPFAPYMSSWARWITAWWRPMAFLAGFTSMILWIHDNNRDNISTEQDIESGQKDPLSVKDVRYENLFVEAD
jgi:hypothetical protein